MDTDDNNHGKIFFADDDEYRIYCNIIFVIVFFRQIFKQSS